MSVIAQQTINHSLLSVTYVHHTSAFLSAGHVQYAWWYLVILHLSPLCICYHVWLHHFIAMVTVALFPGCVASRSKVREYDKARTALLCLACHREDHRSVITNRKKELTQWWELMSSYRTLQHCSSDCRLSSAWKPQLLPLVGLNMLWQEICYWVNCYYIQCSPSTTSFMWLDRFGKQSCCDTQVHEHMTIPPFNADSF